MRIGQTPALGTFIPLLVFIHLLVPKIWACTVYRTEATFK